MLVLASHNLWIILNTLENVKRLSENNTLLGYLENVIEVHQQWFPESRLASSWGSISSSMDSGY
jgi:queuine/archaeosine tRNA-ribosyltransferase